MRWTVRGAGFALGAGPIPLLALLGSWALGGVRPAPRRAGRRITWNRVERRLLCLRLHGQLVPMSVVGVAVALSILVLGLVELAEPEPQAQS